MRNLNLITQILMSQYELINNGKKHITVLCLKQVKKQHSARSIATLNHISISCLTTLHVFVYQNIIYNKFHFSKYHSRIPGLLKMKHQDI